MFVADRAVRGIRDNSEQLPNVANSKASEATARLTMVLPLPPSVNNLYVSTPTGRIKSKEGKLYKMAVCEELQVQHARQRASALEPPYEVWMWFMLPDRKVRDVSNMVKAIEDNVAESLGYNDSLHHAMHLYKAIDRDNPRAVMVLAHKWARIPDPGAVMWT
jgi:Holliday junction resolvase RusA-like endonuclease